MAVPFIFFNIMGTIVIISLRTLLSKIKVVTTLAAMEKQIEYIKHFVSPWVNQFVPFCLCPREETFFTHREGQTILQTKVGINILQ